MDMQRGAQWTRIEGSRRISSIGKREMVPRCNCFIPLTLTMSSLEKYESACSHFFSSALMSDKKLNLFSSLRRITLRKLFLATSIQKVLSTLDLPLDFHRSLVFDYLLDCTNRLVPRFSIQRSLKHSIFEV